MLTRREQASLEVEEAAGVVEIRRGEWLDAVLICIAAADGPACDGLPPQASHAHRQEVAQLSREAFAAYQRALQALEAAEYHFDKTVEADCGTWAYRPGMQGPGGFGTVPREFDD